MTISNLYLDQNVLVTGGAGFIGSNLSRKLVDLGANVTVVDSLIPDYGGNIFNLQGYEKKLSLNIADIRDPYSMNYLVQGKNFLFNLAGQISHTDSMKNPYIDLEINVTSQLSILEACRIYNPDIRIIFASTRQIYGIPQYLPVNEQHPIRPVDVNGINKHTAEQYFLLYNRIYNIAVTVLRLTNVFGPRMRIKDARQTFIGWWIRQIIEGQKMNIFGDGLQLRDFNFIDDVVDALLTVGTNHNAFGNTYNLGSNPISLKDLAELMIKINGFGNYELKPFPPERKVIDIGSFHADYSKIKSELFWEPKTDLKTGLEETISYYRKYLEYYL